MMGNGQSKALRLIGIAKKAGKLICGTEMVVEAIRSKKTQVKAVFVSGDAGANTMKRLTNTTSYYGVPLIKLSADKTELGRMAGSMSGKTSVAVTDRGIAEAAIESLKNGEGE